MHHAFVARELPAGNGRHIVVNAAAQRLFIHANTVRYRLRRYEELTGTDLSVTDEAFRVWWAIHRDQAGAA